MRIEQGKLVDYNYFDLKEIVQEAMTQWRKQKLLGIVNEFKKFIIEL